MINTGPIQNREREKLDSNTEDLTIGHFASKYEKLVDVVCAGAKFGSSPGLESRYVTLREWMLPRVGHATKILAEHHASNPDKIALLLERLLASTRLVDLLGADDGSLIQRMTWISQALFDAGMDD